MNQPAVDPTHVSISGDFARVFDHEDYIAMVNAIDEASVVLRGHLILEEFLNIWASRLTQTDDLFAGTFVQFKTKLCVCRNLGLATPFFDTLDKFNDVRNRYSHRRKYKLEANTLDSLRSKVDAIESEPKMLKCDEFELYLEGVDRQTGERMKQSYTWATADTQKRVLVVLIVLVLKFVAWMQREFNSRGVKYDLVAWPATPSSAA